MVLDKNRCAHSHPAHAASPCSQIMPARKSTARRVATSSVAASSSEIDVDSVIKSLKRLADKRTLDGMARYAIPSDKAFGVPMRAIQDLGKRLGPNHKLAAALWNTGWYEARTLAAFVEEPQRVTAAQMDRWVRDFDSWAICDTVCFKLFDRVPHAFDKVLQWSELKDEFGKRAAFALLASLALHSKCDDAQFARYLPLIRRAAADQRNFVKKGVSWALRAIGRRGPQLTSAAIEIARRLAASEQAGERWVGKDAFKELTRFQEKRQRSTAAAT
jgi:3-methyladenine DNA glycosylase AlkD